MKEQVKGKTANVFWASLGVALSVAVWISASNFPAYDISIVGPDYFPKMLAGGLFLASLGLMISSIGAKKDVIFDTLSLKDKGVQRVLIAFAATLLLAIVMPHLGFIPTAILYMFGIMVLLQNRAWLKMAIISVVVPIAVSVLFEKLLGIFLPLGVLANFL